MWTGDGRVFFYNPSQRVSLWERPEDLQGRADVDKMVQTPPEAAGTKETMGSFRLNSTNFKRGSRSTISELAEVLATCCKIYLMQRFKVFFQYLKYFLRYCGFRDPTVRRHFAKSHIGHFLSIDISRTV